jgi:hypothetical protein
LPGPSETYDADAAQSLWRANWREDPPVGDVGTTLIFENEHVRVWDLRLAPGETSPLHTHEHPYIFVVIEPATVRTRFADGSESIDDDAAGAAVWVGVDDRRTHTLTNVDSRRYINRVVEVIGGTG